VCVVCGRSCVGPERVSRKKMPWGTPPWCERGTAGVVKPFSGGPLAYTYILYIHTILYCKEIETHRDT
jgi:hypothetical protein